VPVREHSLAADGDGGSSPADRRDRAADERDRIGRQRDHAADRRDHAGEDRDRAADQRDLTGDERDQAATERDRAGEQREHSGRPSGAGTHGAGSDRVEASDDRQAGAAGRIQAEGDRDDASGDRTSGASDRTLAEADRESARADRVAAASDRWEASLDPLTGASYRGAGFIELEHNIARAKRTHEPLILVFADIDGLKAVNDSRGHAAGDRLLLEVANAFRAALRPYDLLIRFGGDEFICAISGVSMGQAVERLARVDAALAAATEPGSVTMGIAELRPDDSIETFVARADAALYEERKRHPGPWASADTATA